MKTLRFFVLFEIFHSALCDNATKTVSLAPFQELVPYAINQILKEHHSKDSRSVDSIFYGQKGGRGELLFEKILSIQTCALEVSNDGIKNPWKLQLKLRQICCSIQWTQNTRRAEHPKDPSSALGSHSSLNKTKIFKNS